MVHKMKRSEKWVKVGEVGVDTAGLLLVDPLYIREGLIPEYDKISDARLGKKVKGIKATSGGKKYPHTLQINFPKGHKGAGVVTETGLGDGLYPVHAKIIKDKHRGERVSEIRVKFI